MSWESFVLSWFLEKTSTRQELVAPQMFSKLTHKNILTRFVFIFVGGEVLTTILISLNLMFIQLLMSILKFYSFRYFCINLDFQIYYIWLL